MQPRDKQFPDAPLAATVRDLGPTCLGLLARITPNSVATKLYLLAVLILTAIVGMATASVHFSQLTSDAADRVHQQGFIGLVTATDLEVTLHRHRRIVESAPAEVDRATIALDRESLTGLAGRLATLAAGIEREEVRNAVDAMALSAVLPELFKLGERVLHYAENFAQNQALDTAAIYSTTAGVLQKRIDRYRTGRIEIARNEAARVSVEAHGFVRWITLCVLCVLLVLGPLSVSITRRIVSRLAKIQHVTLRLAADDTSVVVPSTLDPDEIGDIARAVDIFKCNAIALLDYRRQIEQTNLEFSVALEHMSQGLCMFDKGKRVVVSNRRYGELYGLAPDSIRPGTSLAEIIEMRLAKGVFPRGKLQDYARERLEDARTLSHQVDELSNDRTISIVRRSMPDGGWVTTHEDVTELRRAEARIKHLAHHDALTDLANRVQLRSRAAECVAALERQQKFALLCLDLDHFKDVNDTLGHPVGDELLKLVADRLRHCVRSTDLVARIGGDEFAILQIGIEGEDDVLRLARRLIEHISEPYLVGEHKCLIGVSIGIAMAPRHGGESEELARRGDLALYRAKEAGRGGYRVFDETMEQDRNAKLGIAADLRGAISQNELHLVYQPIVDLESRTIGGFEALMRWRHPGRGLIPPRDFIPIAEETGLINSLGIWALNEATREAASWRQPARIAVNLSPVQFKHRDIAQIVIDALTASGLAPHLLELEITESVLLHNTQATLAALHRLRAFGVRIALDDFGTGYSSLSYLQNFPFDAIKIDQSFVRNLATRSGSVAIIRLVAALANSFGMETVAEGVETASQLALIKSAGCTHAQGYFFSRPVPSGLIAQVHETCTELLDAAA